MRVWRTPGPRREINRVDVSRERIARSDERTASVPVFGHQPGYSVPVHHRGRNTCIQARQSLETKEDDPGPLDGTQDEPSGGKAPLGLLRREGKRPRYVVTRGQKSKAARGTGHRL